MTSKPEALFPCDCGGAVRLTPTTGETWELFRDVNVTLPDHTLLPICDRCGDRHLGPADEKRLEALARAAYAAEQARRIRADIEQIRLTHAVDQGEVERACGVTPTYLSHAMGGKRLASLTLERLLAAFAASPRYFQQVRATWTGKQATVVVLDSASSLRMKFAAAERGKMRKLPPVRAWAHEIPLPDAPASKTSIGS